MKPSSASVGVAHIRTGVRAPDSVLYASDELYVLGKDGDPLGVDGAELSVLEQVYEERLSRLSQREHGFPLHADGRLELLRNLKHEPKERRKRYERVKELLQPANLHQRPGSRPELVRLLLTTDGLGCALLSGPGHRFQ